MHKVSLGLFHHPYYQRAENVKFRAENVFLLPGTSGYFMFYVADFHTFKKKKYLEGESVLIYDNRKYV